MQHVFSAWGEISLKIKEAKRILLLSDYDGTLTPIVERPELANLSEEVRQLLKKLARHRRIKLGIISGRALTDLKQKVGIGGIIYSGNHGLEMEGPGINFIHPLAEEFKPILRLISRVLTQATSNVQGVFVEHKGLTLSVHYRLAKDDQEEQVRGIFNTVLAGARSIGKVKTTSGKKVLEVRPPVKWHKGKAVQLILKKYGKGGIKSGTLPIYLGDDLTDEDAFEFLERCGGISIFVGEETSHTRALYYVKSPAEVKGVLQIMLAQTLRKLP